MAVIIIIPSASTLCILTDLGNIQFNYMFYAFICHVLTLLTLFILPTFLFYKRC